MDLDARERVRRDEKWEIRKKRGHKIGLAECENWLPL